MSDTENLRWYVVNSKTNTEKSVARDLKERIERMELSHLFGEILVPSEEVVDMKNGQKRVTERKFFPGYVLVQIKTDTSTGMPLISNEAWHLVRSTPKVAGFIGGTHERPLPITDTEAQRILNRLETTADKPVLKHDLTRGQEVRIKEGPFVDFNAVVEDYDVNKGTVKVAVLVFGRPTPIELQASQIEATVK